MEKYRINDLLLIRFFNGSASEQEADSVINYLNESKENQLNYFHIKRIWLESAIESKDSEIVNNSWKRLRMRIDGLENETHGTENKNIKLTIRRLALAASIAILCVFSTYFIIQYYRIGQFVSNESEIVVPYGSRSNVTLPDGSSVWLNSGTKLIYNSSFNRRREVSLSGEAFFDVKKLNKRQFIVNTSDLRIKVHGTAFNIKSYPEEQIIETTLVKGLIEIESIKDQGAGGNILLAPQQRLIYTIPAATTSDQIQNEPLADDKLDDMQKIIPKNMQLIHNVDTEEYSSWKDGKLIIKSEYLKDLAVELERYYNVDISFLNDSIKNFKYSGTLNEVTIEEVMGAIASTSPIHYEISNNKVILTLKRVMNESNN
ncbi:MAG: FecR family protein [Bacteroidales bacterium]|nr:FecR family protein [Bacteroidales bacterium]